MLVKFHARGKGCGAGPIDYLLGRDRDRDRARLLRGDPEMTVDIIDSLSFKKRYTSGVLSFEESNISEEEKYQIMDTFEEVIFCGMKIDQYSILWVEHTDKDRLELNFVIPNVELKTGKRFQPYYHKVDLKRVDNFKELVNHVGGFSSPNDPEKKRTYNLGKIGQPSHEKTKKVIGELLGGMVKKGIIKDRGQLIIALQNLGYTVARIAKKSVSIKPPSGVRNIRLTGAMYEDCTDYNDLRELRSEELELQLKLNYGHAKQYIKKDYSIENAGAVGKEMLSQIVKRSSINAEKYKLKDVSLSSAEKEYEDQVNKKVEVKNNERSRSPIIRLLESFFIRIQETTEAIISNTRRITEDVRLYVKGERAIEEESRRIKFSSDQLMQSVGRIRNELNKEDEVNQEQPNSFRLH